MLDNFIHHRLGLTDSKTADGVSGKIHGNETLSAFFTKIRINAALNNAKEILRVFRGPLLPVHMTALRPSQGAFHRPICFEMSRWVCEAVVENHEDVGAEGHLDVDGDFRAQKLSAAIEVGLKSDPVFTDVPQRTETENLITAAVGENGPIPSHELVQAAESGNRFMTRSKKKVIRVA